MVSTISVLDSRHAQPRLPDGVVTPEEVVAQHAAIEGHTFVEVGHWYRHGIEVSQQGFHVHRSCPGPVTISVLRLGSDHVGAPVDDLVAGGRELSDYGSVANRDAERQLRNAAGSRGWPTCFAPEEAPCGR